MLSCEVPFRSLSHHRKSVSSTSTLRSSINAEIFEVYISFDSQIYHQSASTSIISHSNPSSRPWKFQSKVKRTIERSINLSLSLSTLASSLRSTFLVKKFQTHPIHSLHTKIDILSQVMYKNSLSRVSLIPLIGKLLVFSHPLRFMLISFSHTFGPLFSSANSSQFNLISTFSLFILLTLA